MDLESLAKRHNDYQIEMRRYFHAHPEPSRQEKETSKRIGEELTAMGVKWEKAGTGYGIVATIDGNAPGKTFMLRADMDALEVLEDTGAPYASVNKGYMHACGHDCHISMLLTAAKILNEIRSEFKGRVKLAFQPAEEVAWGARDFIDAGVLDDVAACFGIHVWSDFDAGQVSIKPGPRMASADMFDIKVHGKAGHGSQPHQTVDAVVVASAIVQNLQTIVSREVAPNETCVVSVGKIESGTRFNIIAGEAYLLGTTRCFSREVRNELEGQITRIAQGVASAYRATAEVNYTYMLGPTINDPEVTDFAQKAARAVFGENFQASYEFTMGAEDFSEYGLKVPSAIALLGVRNEACGSIWPQHSNHYCVDESVLVKGALLHAMTAVNFLNSH
ncbi:MAG TPA: amidohydrolase [Sutterella sp.]|nr:amidohydrolase [Sutterella sp.]